jgi:hypothetical protein
MQDIGCAYVCNVNLWSTGWKKENVVSTTDSSIARRQSSNPKHRKIFGFPNGVIFMPYKNIFFKVKTF